MSTKRPQRHESGDVALESREKVRQPRLYKVVVHNDDYTTMEFVIDVLQRFFQKSHAEALSLTLYVHHKGRAVAGVYPRDVAETRVALTVDYARSKGHPLLLTVEPE